MLSDERKRQRCLGRALLSCPCSSTATFRSALLGNISRRQQRYARTLRYSMTARDLSGLAMAQEKTANQGNLLVNEVANFAETVLKLCERNDELRVARNNLNRSLQIINDIKASTQNLQTISNTYNSQLEANKRDYEGKVDKLKDGFSNMAESTKKQMLDEVKDSFDAYQNTFKEMRDSQTTLVQTTIDTLNQKLYSLQEASINSRFMIQSLYNVSIINI